MRDLRFTLLGDGASDEVLLVHARWLLLQLVASDVALQASWADLSRLKTPARGLTKRIRCAVQLYPCDVLFVHRDAEREDPSTRMHEIRSASESAGIVLPPIVPVVPVRMMESWLLFDEQAIRSAAGNPNGTAALDLPEVREIESVADPKAVLHAALSRASGLTGRRLRKFQPRSCARRVAEMIDQFSPLMQLGAFAQLQVDLKSVVIERGWHLEPDA